MESTRRSVTSISTSPVGISLFLLERSRTTPLAASTNSARTPKLAENFLVRVVVKGQLYNAGAVAQVDENQLSQVALPLGPSAYHNLLAHVGKPRLSAVVGSFQSCHHFCHMISSFRFPVIFPWFFVDIDFSQAVKGPACSEPSLRRICFSRAVCQNATRRRVPVRAESPFHPLISSDCFARRNRSG